MTNVIENFKNTIAYKNLKMSYQNLKDQTENYSALHCKYEDQ